MYIHYPIDTTGISRLDNPVVDTTGIPRLLELLLRISYRFLVVFRILDFLKLTVLFSKAYDFSFF